MVKTDMFSLQTLAGGKPQVSNQTEQSTLLYAGEETGLILEGVQLEAQFEHDGQYLLFVTENSPFEEGLHIYLLSKGNGQFKLLDSIEVGLPYAAGMLRNVRVDNTNNIHFEFPNEDNKYICSLLSPPRRFVNPIKQVDVSRPNWFFQQRYLLLNKDSSQQGG